MMSGSRNSLKKAQTFNPRANNDWSKDDSKFGLKMLEKMGWKKGQGIGLNNQGIAENIQVRLKLDSKGLGYKVKEDQWLEVRSEFSELLAQLNESVADENEAMNKEKKSLEAISQSCRTRVHYHKFTHGKDIAKYKKEDLIGILGKKEEPEKSAIPDKEEFIQSGNMEEYFKNKKKKKLDTSYSNAIIDEQTSDEINLDNCTNNEHKTLEEENIDKIPKRKKSKNSSKEKNDSNLDNAEFSNTIECLPQQTFEENQVVSNESSNVTAECKKSSKKKRTYSEIDSEQNIVNTSSNNEDTEPKKNSKKKHKISKPNSETKFPNDEIEISESTVTILSENEDSGYLKKSKKKPKSSKIHSESKPTNGKESIESNTITLVSDNDIESEKNPKKKRKCSKIESNSKLDDDETKLPQSISLLSDDECSNSIKDSKKKSKKKRKNSDQNTIEGETNKTESITVDLLSENEAEDCSKGEKLKNECTPNDQSFEIDNSKDERKENNTDENAPKKKRKRKNDITENPLESTLPFCIDVKAEPDLQPDDLPIKKKKKSKKEETTSTEKIQPQDEVKNSISSVVDYNDSKSVEDYIKHFEKNRDELLNKYREKYKTKFLLSSSENIIQVFGDEFDGRKLDVKKPANTPVKYTRKRTEKTKMSKAERIVAKARLLKSIKDKAATHNFKGSNLTKIQGYGSVIY